MSRSIPTEKDLYGKSESESSSDSDGFPNGRRCDHDLDGYATSETDSDCDFTSKKKRREFKRRTGQRLSAGRVCLSSSSESEEDRVSTRYPRNTESSSASQPRGEVSVIGFVPNNPPSYQPPSRIPYYEQACYLSSPYTNINDFNAAHSSNFNNRSFRNHTMIQDQIQDVVMPNPKFQQDPKHHRTINLHQSRNR